jgi:hypothetical protein
MFIRVSHEILRSSKYIQEASPVPVSPSHTVSGVFLLLVFFFFGFFFFFAVIQFTKVQSREAVIMGNGEDILVTQKIFRENGSDTDTDSIIDDVINMEKENPRFHYTPCKRSLGGILE